MSKIIEFNDEEIKLIEKAIGNSKKRYCSREHEVYKDILEKLLKARDWRDLAMFDVKTGEEWDIDFTFVAFPGLEHSGYRVEGFRKIGTMDNHLYGEREEFGTLIISDGELKIIQW